LIAVDASRGSDATREAGRLADALRERGIPCGVSRWDASGLFADLLLANRDDVVVSPRMLTLLYAADLVFRLRWEIRPALAEGQVVIAAPYLHTAFAVGAGIGLPEAWTQEILRFAPAADARRFARERKPGRGWRPRPERGYGEFCATVLREAPSVGGGRSARRRAMESLEKAATAAGAARRKDILAAIGTRPEGPRRSPARPRSGRT
jgi:hypothetical protein